MNILFVLIFGLILIVYGFLNYYIGLRLWQSFGSFIPYLHPVAYWIVFMFIAFSYIVGRMGTAYLPKALSHWLTLIGAYWMGAMVYFLIVLAVIDLVRLGGGALRLLSSQASRGFWNSPVIGISVLIIVAGIVFYGIYNAGNPRITHYDINVEKAAKDLDKLHIVMVSDIHIGNIVKKDRVAKMVEMINSRKPDIILLAGDIIDEDVEPFVKQGINEEFSQLKAKYGVYAVMGNHEYYRGQVNVIEEEFGKANINVLRDTYVKIADSFYLVGREDRESKRVLGKARKQLEEILAKVDKSLPVIVMDHTPANLKEAEAAGADVQLSGHTHRGQLYPNQHITKRMYEVDWGYLKKGSLNVVVSSGFGTWGAPMRTGNSPEIVDISLSFNKK